MGVFKNMAIGIEQIVDNKTKDFDNLPVAMGLLAAIEVIREVNSDERVDPVLHDALVYAAEHAIGLGSAAQAS